MARLVNPTVAYGIQIPYTDLKVYHLCKWDGSSKFVCGAKGDFTWADVKAVADIDKGAICRDCLNRLGLEAEDNPPAESLEYTVLLNRVTVLERKLAELKAGSDGTNL